ncbi:MAG: hypothetical protein J7559_08910 [Cohnella sp.]|nr:hypothetical protein [Cohnella sp.]
MNIGQRIYYDLPTGNVLVNTGERTGNVVETTTEQDFESYIALKDRVPSTVGCLQLEYGEYEQDFAACNGYKVDVSGKIPSLLFSYPDPANPESPPVYEPPFSIKVAEQELRIADVELALAELFTGGA